MRTTALALFLITAPVAAFAQMSHGNHAEMATTGEGVHAEATLNAIGDGTVNVSHGPIAAIGWPAMTMDLPLIGDVDTSGVAAGDTVMIMLEKGSDGMYGVSGIEPAQ